MPQAIFADEKAAQTQRDWEKYWEQTSILKFASPAPKPPKHWAECKPEHRHQYLMAWLLGLME